MSGLKSIVVAGGSGDSIGAYLVKHLLLHKATQPGLSIRILSRGPADPNSNPPTLHADYDNAESIYDALKAAKADCLLSALNSFALGTPQKNMVIACKKAGIKVFSPSDYGGGLDVTTDMDHLPGKEPNIHEIRDQIVKDCKDAGVPYLRIATGGWPDRNINTEFSPIKTDPPSFTIVGDGNMPQSMTTRDDVGAFVSYAILNLPLSRLQNNQLLIEGDRKTSNEMVAIFRELLVERGRKAGELVITRIDQDALMAGMRAKLLEGGSWGENFVASIMYKALSGSSIVGDGNDNQLFPGFKPKDFKTVLSELLK